MDTEPRIVRLQASDYELIRDGPKSMVLVNPHDPTGQTLIKVFHPHRESDVFFFNELGCGRAFEHPGIRRVIGTVRFNNRDGLLLPNIPGTTLRELLKKGPLSIYQSIDYALKAADLIGTMHRAGWFHLNLHSDNVLLTPEKNLVLIGLSGASRVPLSSAMDTRLNGASMGLLAPEQTGRLNRPVDHCADLYALGVLLYEMLCGRLPLEADGTIDLLHSILSKEPAPPSAHNPEIPGGLDALVLQLLQKEPENRYGTAEHLAADLVLCQRDLRERRNIVSRIPSVWPLKKERFRIPQKLYGRDAELQTLFHSYERVAEGAAEVVMVSSGAGMGKTALVMELQQYVDKKQGFFVSGKFEQFQRNLPHLALNQAMSSLINRFLLDEDEAFRHWQQVIRTAVADHGAVLSGLIPRLELIIGPQSGATELPSSEALNRLNYVYKEFVRAIASRKHPLVIFLDDVHWADSTSIEFIRWLMTNRDVPFLQLVLAYRPEEVGATHPLYSLLQDLQTRQIASLHIELKHLTAGDILLLLDDVFGTDAGFREELAASLWRKTQGNAFFVRQMLNTLHQEQLVAYDGKLRQWKCDLDGIDRRQIVDDVADLLIPRMQRLAPDVASLLHGAACIGTRFELHQLGHIREESPGEILSGLQILMSEGFIEKRHHRYFFVHDRIQQAAYTLLHPADRQMLHYRMGMQLLGEPEDGKDKMRLFEILHHLNKAGDRIDTDALRLQLAGLNLEAARNAAQVNATAPAAEYLKQARDNLSHNSWQGHYPLTLDVYRESAEAAFLLSDYGEMERFIGEIVAHARSVSDKIPAYEIRIMALRAQSRLHESVELVEEVLSLLRLRFPSKPNILHVLALMLRIEWLLRGKSRDDLLRQPEMTDPDARTIMRILSRHDSTVYIVNQALMPLVLMKQLELTLRFGRAPVSPSAYLAYGVIVQTGFGNIRRGYRLAQLAREMVQLPESRMFRSRVIYGSMALIDPFSVPIRDTVKPAMDAHIFGLEDGDFEHASFAAFVVVHHQLHGGKKLGPLCAQVESFLGTLEPLRQQIPLNLLRIYHQFLLNLTGRSQNPLLLDGNSFRESQVPALQEGGDFLSFNLFSMTKAFLLYSHGQPAEALSAMAASYRYWDTIRSNYSGALYMFHRSLYAAACYHEAPTRERAGLMKLIDKGISHLRRLSKHCPENHLNKLLLVKAEKYRLLGRKLPARSLYDQSIAAARAHQFIQEEALAFELAGNFYHQSGEWVQAEIYLQKAHDAYRSWGAPVLADHLASRFPEVVRRSSAEPFDEAQSDAQALMEMARTLSGEIELDRLVEKLMDLVVKTGGAQSGVLLMMADHQIRVVAHRPEGEATKRFAGLPVAEASFLSQAVVNFTARTLQTVVVEDALTDPTFSADVYLKSRNVRSLVCLPLLNQGQLAGMLYIENNLLSKAFKPERITLLQTLSGQIAVSLVNAQLYHRMEELVQKRTSEIESERRKSEELLMNILPESVARELKKDGRATPRKLEEVTVLFTDFVGFTRIAEQLAAEELVAEIDYCFRQFDRIVSRNGLEKIKTIGDAYMCAAGLPIPEENAALRAVQAALDILQFMEELSKSRGAEGRQCFEIRIGLHTGPVVAGVVGTKKFTYDIWGDTVNTASRMESSGQPGAINISGATYHLVKDLFRCEYRGRIQAKNKGEVDMYWVLGRNNQ